MNTNCEWADRLEKSESSVFTFAGHGLNKVFNLPNE